VGARDGFEVLDAFELAVEGLGIAEVLAIEGLSKLNRNVPLRT
jgi:hypothetical protein